MQSQQFSNVIFHWNLTIIIPDAQITFFLPNTTILHACSPVLLMLEHSSKEVLSTCNEDDKKIKNGKAIKAHVKILYSGSCFIITFCLHTLSIVIPQIAIAVTVKLFFF